MSDSHGAAMGDAAAGDLELVQEILAGSVQAWHRFIDAYGALILHVVRRNLRADEDEIRTVFVAVLEHLYRGSLASYEGRARLSTWLVLVARNQTLDHLRKRLGRREPPAALARMSPEEREIFKAYHWEGSSVEQTRERLALLGYVRSQQEILASLRRIESQLDERSLRRLAYDAEAASMGGISGRLLEFLDEKRRQEELAHQESSPLQALIASEARQTVARIQALIADLPADERQVLQLRFEHEESAKEIARIMQLQGQRRAYTLLERALRHVRRALSASGETSSEHPVRPPERPPS